MDMELQRTRLGGFRPVYDSLLRQEETLESIVPDALPDIARIVDTSGTAFLRQKEAIDGCVRVTGTVRACVLYLPEGEGAPCCLSLNIPFLCSADHPAISEGCRTQVSLNVVSADAQVLNPRKVLVRTEVAVTVTAYAEETAEVCEAVDQGGDSTLQTLVESYKDFTTMDIAEKSFSFSDILRLPSSRLASGSLLSSRAELGCAEAKVIGKKLVVKGDAVLNVLYPSEGGVTSSRFEMPFSQIVEIGAGGEDCGVSTQVLLTGLTCELRSDSELEVSLDVLIQAAVQWERDVSMLSDLYSTSNLLETDRENIRLCTLVDQGSRRQIARQFCESAIAAKQVIECRLSIGELTQEPAGEGNVAVTAKAYADVLYLSEDDALCAGSYTIPAVCELPVPAGSKCVCRCRPVGEVAATPVTDGLEVRFEAEFSFQLTQIREVSCVSAIRPGQGEGGECERPSVIIRMVGEGERLWDIAKCCGSTVADIKAANAMSADEAACGTLLLIPKCR